MMTNNILETGVFLLAMFGGLWLLVILGRRLDARNAARQAEMARDSERERLTDEGIHKCQIRFEQRAMDRCDLPDHLGWQEVYKYRHLMRDAYTTLAARHRYAPEILSQVKQDWLDYLDTVGRHATTWWLFLETREEARREVLLADARLELAKMEAVENAFVGAMGPEAMAKLSAVRESFDPDDIEDFGDDDWEWMPSNWLSSPKRRRHHGEGENRTDLVLEPET